MQTINVRTLQRNMKEISEKVQQGESFAVFKNSNLIFQLIPANIKDLTINQDNKAEDDKKNKKTTSAYEAFRDIRFSSGTPDLSQHIDEIVYKN